MKKIVVLGDANIDFIINLIRVPDKGEKVPAGTLGTYLGGQGVNQTIAAKRAGAQVDLYSKLGNDVFAGLLEGMLAKQGIGLDGMFRDEKLQSGTVVVFLGKNGETCAAAVRGAYYDFTEDEIDKIKFQGAGIAIAQLLLPQKAVARFFSNASKKGCTTILNCSPQIKTDKKILEMPDYLIMNETEFAFHSGSKLKDTQDPAKMAKISDRIRRKGQTIIVTLGERGLFFISDKMQKSIPAHKVKPVDTIGAGDCLIGAFAACLAKGKDLEYSLRFANAAAAISIQKTGAAASMPYESEIIEMLAEKR